MAKHKFKRNKYNVSPKDRRMRDGITFDSLKEAKYYDELKLRMKSGDVIFFLRQTPFHLPGRVSYRCDFTVFKADGHVEFIDVKGYDTPASKMKRKIVEAQYPVEILLA